MRAWDSVCSALYPLPAGMVDMSSVIIFSHMHGSFNLSTSNSINWRLIVFVWMKHSTYLIHSTSSGWSLWKNVQHQTMRLLLAIMGRSPGGKNWPLAEKRLIFPLKTRFTAKHRIFSMAFSVFIISKLLSTGQLCSPLQHLIFLTIDQKVTKHLWKKYSDFVSNHKVKTTLFNEWFGL